MDKLPQILAHRGGRYWTADNFSYITEALRDGADGVELDVRLHSGAYVVQHDFRWSYQGTLEEAITRCEGAPIMLDVKETGIDAQHLINFVLSRTAGPISVVSMYPSVLAQLRGQRIPLCLSTFALRSPIPLATSLGVHSIHVPAYRLSPQFVSQVHAHGLHFAPWACQFKTGDESSQLQAVSLGAYAIATYHVSHMREQLSQQNP